MKYCLSVRQSRLYLKQADEIYIEERDYGILPDILIKYPDKIIIQEIPEDMDNTLLKKYVDENPNFCIEIKNFNNLQWLQENNVKWQYKYEVDNFYDLRALEALKPEYIKITGPLVFNKRILSNSKIKFRAVPNLAYRAYIPRANGITGHYIRPEDVKYFEDSIYVFNFEDCDLKKEKVLFDIYKSGEWKGDLNYLITNLEMSVPNVILPDDFGKYRSKCGQRCAVTGTCHYCDTAVKFTAAIRQEAERRRTKPIPIIDD